MKHGNCRVLAARDVVPELRVLVVEPPRHRGEKILDQLGENLLQGGLSAMDTASALKTLRDFKIGNDIPPAGTFTAMKSKRGRAGGAR